MDRDLEQSPGSESTSGWQARPLSAEFARKLLERTLWDETLPYGTGTNATALKEVAGRHREMVEVNETLLHELVRAVVLTGLNLRPQSAAAVADVTDAVAHSIYGDTVALQRVQAWWDRLRGSVV